MIKVESANAEPILQAIINKIFNLKINHSKIVSQSYDGAAVMSGNTAGVHKLIIDFYQRDIQYIHCFNTQFHLAVMEIVECLPIVRRSFDLAEKLYTFFKRLLTLSKNEGTKLQRLLTQRLSGHLATIEVIKMNLPEICKVLFEFTAESYPESSEVEGLLNRTATLEFCCII